METKSASAEDLTEFLRSRLELDGKKGVLRVDGLRSVIADAGVIVSVQKELEELIGSAARAPVYAAGERTAGRWARVATRLLEGEGFKTISDALHQMGRMWTSYGYGRVTIDFRDLAEGSVDFTVENSVLAEAYGPAKGPVCHFFAGFGAGLFQALFDREVHCHETACAATGAPRCTFEMAPLERFYHHPEKEG